MKFSTEEKQVLYEALLSFAKLRQGFESQLTNPVSISESKEATRLGEALRVRVGQSLKSEAIQDAANEITNTVYFGAEGKGGDKK